MAKKKNTHVGWCIPASVYKEVARMARAERRTINAQAVLLLSEALEARKEIADALRDHVWYARENKGSARQFHGDA